MADHGGGYGQRQAEENRDAEAVDDAGGDVPRLIVRAEPVEIAEDAGRVLRSERIARTTLLLFHQPEGCRGSRMRDVGVDRLVGIADRRPDHPAIRLDLVGNEGGPVVGGGEEATELLFRIVHQHRKQYLALVGRYNRPVIRDEFRKQAEREDDHEDPEGPVAAPVRLEVLQTAAIGR